MKFFLKGIWGLSTLLKESLPALLGGARKKSKWRNCCALIGFLLQSCKAQKTPSLQWTLQFIFNCGLEKKLL